LFTGFIAALIGTLIAWGIIVHLMRMSWTLFPSGIVLVVIVCLSLTLILGFAGTWRALGAKAAPHLRNH